MTNYRPALLFISFLMLPSSALPAAEDARDFSGLWQAFASSPSPADASRAALTPDGEILLADFSARYPNPVEPGAYCVPSGMPTMMTSIDGTAIEIVHSFNRITLIGADGQLRRIFLDGRAPPADSTATRVGYSVGRWDNDDLVIETTLLDDMLTGPWPRTENTTIVEHVTKTTRDLVSASPDASIDGARLDDEVLAVQLTINDASLYRAPQTLTVYYQHVAEDALGESGCAAELWQQALDAANQ